MKYQYNCYFYWKDFFFHKKQSQIENSGFVKTCDEHVLRLIFSGIEWLRPIQCCCLHGLFWNGRLWCIWAFPLISDSHHRAEPMKPGIKRTFFFLFFFLKIQSKKCLLLVLGLLLWTFLLTFLTMNFASIRKWHIKWRPV